MDDTSDNEIEARDVAYYRRRQQNRVFAALAAFFAEEAAKGNISKKEIAEALNRDPAQITRWLSAPSNLQLDTISDLLLAMGAEMDHSIVRFTERAKPNYVHPMLTRYVHTASDETPRDIAKPTIKVSTSTSDDPITKRTDANAEAA
jgi:hypothetical protein